MYPDVGFNTENTIEYILNTINSFNYDKSLINYYYIITNHSLIITLSTKKSKIIGFRAELDGLDIKENSNVKYKSKNSYMHACGHDGHMAILIRTIEYFLLNPKTLNGTVRFIFQAAEEGPGDGGAMLIKEHPLVKEIDFLYALHVNSEFDTNVVYTNNKYIMANGKTFKIQIFGKASHVVRLDKGIDAVKIGHKIYNKIYKLNRNKHIYFIGRFNGGIATNVVADKCVIEGTCRYFKNTNIERVIESIVKKYSVHYLLSFNKGYSAIKNNNNSYNLLKKVCNENNIIFKNINGLFYTDDFSNYTNSKLCYFFLGTKTVKSTPLHSDDFEINEDALYTGFIIFINLIKEYLKMVSES